MSDRIFNPGRIHKLEDPERLTWLPPLDVIRLLNLASGMSVADIGAGSGYFAIPFARTIAPTGRLFAVDLQPEMLEFLAAKLRTSEAPSNLELIAGDNRYQPRGRQLRSRLPWQRLARTGRSSSRAIGDDAHPASGRPPGNPRLANRCTEPTGAPCRPSHRCHRHGDSSERRGLAGPSGNQRRKLQLSDRGRRSHFAAYCLTAVRIS